MKSVNEEKESNGIRLRKNKREISQQKKKSTPSIHLCIHPAMSSHADAAHTVMTYYSWLYSGATCLKPPRKSGRSGLFLEG